MRTLLGTSLALLLAGGLMFTVGCSGTELDQARAHNNQLAQELEARNAALEALRRDKDQLQAALRDAQLALEAEKAKYATLDQAHRQLLEDYKNLQNQYASRQAPIPVPAGKPALTTEMDQFLKDLAEKYPGFLTYDPERGMVKLNSDLTFEKGSDAVKPEAKALLKKFIELFNIPGAEKYNVYIAGHTDDIPILQGGQTAGRHPTNWYLSVHRAVSVQEEFVKDGYAPSKIGAMGFGEFHPVAPNAAGHHGNQANRRVELWIVPPDRFLTLPMTGEAPVAAPTPATRPARTAVSVRY